MVDDNGEWYDIYDRGSQKQIVLRVHPF
jgi:hypothetical protein